jgi:hypothetical protein
MTTKNVIPANAGISQITFLYEIPVFGYETGMTNGYSSNRRVNK